MRLGGRGDHFRCTVHALLVPCSAQHLGLFPFLVGCRYLFDGTHANVCMMPLSEDVQAHTVMICSPKREIYKVMAVQAVPCKWLQSLRRKR